MRPLQRAWLAMTLGCCAALSCPALLAGEKPAGAPGPWLVDHRYAPVWWQTSICLPDDWQKTLVGKEGTLLYDFPGKHSGFKTRIGLGLDKPTEWVRQELVSPRVPIVRTIKRQGPLEIAEEAFAVAPVLPREEAETTAVLNVERMDQGTLENWAAPVAACDPAFRHIAVGYASPIRYRFRAAPGSRYAVVFGLCEGHWTEPKKRVLELKIEGKTRKTVDMIGEYGRNKPAVFPMQAQDENGDGWVDLAVAAAANAPDQNTILNVLWVFAGDAPPADELLAGRSSRAPLAHVACGRKQGQAGPARHDVVLVHLRNTGPTEIAVTPTLTVESELEIKPLPATTPQQLLIGADTTLVCSQFQVTEKAKGKVVLKHAEMKIPPGKDLGVTIGVVRGPEGLIRPRTLADAVSYRRRAEEYWKQVDLPYGRIEVPDAGIQAQLDSAIRNIYQAREIKNGLPAFQVGPTCYRGLWVVDGSFLMEAVAFLNRAEEARNGIQYLLSFQRQDGAIMLIDGHLKETGIALWAVARHARLTNDMHWLHTVWPKIERGFAYIQEMRATATADPDSPVYRLLPEGFSDGGLGGKNPEYTNVYWTLVGMRAAIEAVQWLGNTRQADDWQREYDDFLATFRKAAERDARTDAHGNRFVPISMRKDAKISPQKAQWAFLHAVFPGKVFALDDPIVRGNMAMLRAVECEGLVRDTGWVANGVWNYFGSFYGHAWLWLGQGQKAAQTLYDFANHASPLLAWREEQMPVGEGPQVCGDMPHNWASAEFIRLVRHLLVLERGEELHLLEGVPPAWIKPGAAVRVRDVLTEFGPISFELTVSADGAKKSLTVTRPTRNPPSRIVVHLDGWTAEKGAIDLPASGRLER